MRTLMLLIWMTVCLDCCLECHPAMLLPAKLCTVHWHRESVSPCQITWSRQRLYSFLWPLQPENPDKFSVSLLSLLVLPVHHLRCMLPLIYIYASTSHLSPKMLEEISIISGLDAKAQLIQYYTQARNIIIQANFNLRSWATNSTTLRQIATADKFNRSCFTIFWSLMQL